MDELILYAQAAAKVAKDALSSSFAIAFISSLAGAFAGALGAQRIAERARKKEDLIKELRNTNSAIMMAFTTCNAAIALKQQHVEPLYSTFMAERKKAFAGLDAATKGLGPSRHHFEADLRIFPFPETPIEALKSLTYHSLSAHGRPLALVIVLEQSLSGLKGAMQTRAEMVQVFASGQLPERAFYLRYFGIKGDDGNTHQLYPDVVEAIKSYVDDVAFFSALLVDDLVSHGERIAKAYEKRFGKGCPGVSSVDFSKPRQKGIIPSNENYADWLNGFTEKSAPEKK